ncbi:unnamed protein product [Orchesella dallaii]|uniref:Uncharacterized protein n=1 Tax=Orchesella dallaii TaxID=48710 RepID=A0ABP1RAR7_9HEXA
MSVLNHKTWPLFAVLLLNHFQDCNNQVQENANTGVNLFSSRQVDYLLTIALSKFQNCSMIFITNNCVKPSSSSVSARMCACNQDLLLNQFGENNLSTYIICAPGPPTNPFDIFQNHEDTHHFKPFCKLIIINLIQHEAQNIESTHNYNASQFAQETVKMMTPINGPVALRDKDHFIFITQTYQATEELLYSSLGTYLKYKLVLLPTEKGFDFHMLCIYCIRDTDSDQSVHGKIIKLQNISTSDTNPEFFPDFTKNFYQYKIPVSGPAIYYPLYEIEEVNGIYRNKRGLHTTMFNAVADKLNMSYLLHPCFGTGFYLPNGTWTGCMADVVYGKSQIGISVGADYQRIKFVQPTTAMFYTFVTFTTRKPSEFHSPTSILTAFRPLVWALVVATFLQITFLLYLDHNLEVRKIQWKLFSRKVFYNERLISLPSPFLHLFGFMLTQSIPHNRIRNHKATYGIWLLYGLVIASAYSGSLQSLIVSPFPSSVPSTFGELIRHEDNYEWGSPISFRAGLGETIFKESTSPVLRKIYKKMKADKDQLACNIRAGMGKYACLNWASIQEFYFKTVFADRSGHHPFKMSKERAFITSMNFITTKGEIFRGYFDKFFQNSFDSGLIQNVIAEDWRKVRLETILKLNANGTDGRKRLVPVALAGPKPFSLENIKGSCFLLCSGLSISFGFLVGEQMHFWWVLHNLKRNGKVLVLVASIHEIPRNKIFSRAHLFPDYTRNFHRHPLRVSAPTKYGAVYEMEKINGSYRNKRGIHAAIFNTIEEKLNFTYVLQPCSGFGNISEGNSGTLLPNGTWTGCVGDVYYGRSDISLAVSPDGNRYHYIQFTTPLRYCYITYVTHKPQIFYPWTTIFLAFHPMGWSMIGISIIFSASTIYCVEKVTTNIETLYGHHNKPRSNFRRHYIRPSLSSNIFYLYGYIVGQDIYIITKGSGSKLIIMSWLFCGFVIGTCYFCSLQALAVSPGINAVPERMPQLLNSNFEWGASRGFRDGLGEDIFRHSQNPVVRKVYEKMKGDSDDIACLHRAANTDYGCFNWDIITEFQIGSQFTDKKGDHPFQFARDNVNFSPVGFVTRKGEIFVAQFNDFISRSFYMGLQIQTTANDMRKFRRSIVQEQPTTTNSDIHFSPFMKRGPKPISLENVKAAFIIIGIGTLLSIVLLIRELIDHHFQ